MQSIIIKQPTIRVTDKKARLSAQICPPSDSSYELWYEVDREYADYLTPAADAFVTALLPYAMQNGLDIEAEGVMSEKLRFQMNTMLIPLLAKYSKIFKSMTVNAASYTRDNYCEVPHSATGFSRGVDSFHAICQALEAKGSNTLTHLTFFNVGSHRSTTGNSPEEAEQLFYDRLKLSEKASSQINLPIVAVNSNLGAQLTLPYIVIHHFCSFSAVLTLQKLFKNYYYASGYDLKEFSIQKCDVCSAYYAPVLAQCLSTESTDFYISGLEKTRMDKIEYISKFPLTYDTLNVCYYEEMNCGHCEKCVRTLYELYATGNLELYKNSFDIESFKRDKNKYMECVLRNQKDGDYHDILERLKQNNMPLTFPQKVKKLVYRVVLKFIRR